MPVCWPCWPYRARFRREMATWGRILSRHIGGNFICMAPLLSLSHFALRRAAATTGDALRMQGKLAVASRHRSGISITA